MFFYVYYLPRNPVGLPLLLLNMFWWYLYNWREKTSCWPHCLQPVKQVCRVYL